MRTPRSRKASYVINFEKKIKSNPPRTCLLLSTSRPESRGCTGSEKKKKPTHKKPLYKQCNTEMMWVWGQHLCELILFFLGVSLNFTISQSRAYTHPWAERAEFGGCPQLGNRHRTSLCVPRAVPTSAGSCQLEFSP